MCGVPANHEPCKVTWRPVLYQTFNKKVSVCQKMLLARLARREIALTPDSVKVTMCGYSVMGRCLLGEMRDVWNWIMSGKKIPCKLKKLRQVNEKKEGP